jgi:hypothetical protein
MRIWSHFRRGVLGGAEPAGLGLFGTAGLSGVSAFATARMQSPATALAGRLIPRDARRSSYCRNGGCDEFAEGDIPLQFDAGHLTAEGAVEVGRRLSAFFVGKLARVDDVPN